MQTDTGCGMSEAKELAENEAVKRSTTQLPIPLRYLLLVSKEKMMAEIEELWYQREMLRKFLAIEDQELWNAQHQADGLASLVSELVSEIEELRAVIPNTKQVI
jgi:hypothetical protein